MARHCRCNNCHNCVAQGNSTGPIETIAAVASLTPASVGGEFVHFSEAVRADLRGREIFAFPGPTNNVGVAGFYLAPPAGRPIPRGMEAARERLGVGGAVVHRVPITAANVAQIFQTRTGALVDNAELTLRIGCGGRVDVATGVIHAGVMGAVIPCTPPQTAAASCCVIL